jgi:signal transduction histidine kinase
VFRSRFLDHLHAGLESGAEAHRAESTLATARAFLATGSLLAIYLDPTEPTRYSTIAYALLTAYALHSLVLMLWLRWRVSGPALRLAAHSIDVLFAAVVTIFTAGANSPLFVFFLFVLLAAAYRWGWRETLATAVAAVAVLLAEAGVMMASDSPALAAIFTQPVEQNRLITRCAYLLIMGVLLGYLAEEDKHRRAEMTFLARLTSRLQGSTSLRGSLLLVLEEMMGLFGSEHALLAVEETTAGRLYLWEARGGAPITLTLREIDSARRDTYLFAPPGDAWYARPAGSGFEVAALDGTAKRRDPAPPLPPAFGQAYPSRSLLLLSIRFGAEWSGHLFLFDPAVGAHPEAELRFLQALVRQTAPALYSTYLVRRMRARAGALERARVAHELHDGVIQSLISLEMQADVLRRRAEGASPEVAEEIARLQRLLHHEILNVRELMLQMRPLELDPQRLLEFLAETVDRFQRDTGITARFVSELDDVRLPPRVCRELARIVQEALANVRKHSGAHNVLVRFGSANGCWRLIVDDDGKGFPFTGHHSQADLDAARRGPLVIKERVRSIGGELAIESTAGGGARLEITLPQTTRA